MWFAVQRSPVAVRNSPQRRREREGKGEEKVLVGGGVEGEHRCESVREFAVRSSLFAVAGNFPNEHVYNIAFDML
jgi:hypothetical protein